MSACQRGRRDSLAKMLRKDLQTVHMPSTHIRAREREKRSAPDVVGEDGLTRSLLAVSRAAGHMRGRRVELGYEETRLRAASVGDDIPRQRETLGEQILRPRAQLLPAERVS